MNHITITWEGDEAVVRVKPSFFELYDVARLDCLKDAIWDLERLYEVELAALNQNPSNNSGGQDA